MIDYARYFDLVECAYYSKDGECDASKTPCPRVGIIVLDTEKEAVTFQSNSISEMLKETPVRAYDFETIREAFLSGQDGTGPSNESYCTSKTLQTGKKRLCYTVYKINRDSVLIFIRDITDKTRLESIAEAVNTMENTGYIFSGIRHEIGNPINSIKMTLSVLKKNLDEFSRDRAVEYIDRALAEISRIEYLLKTLKSFNMFENPVLQKVHLPSFLDSLTSLVESDFGKRGIQIRTLISRDVNYICADQRALQQVMLNVLTNASDALEGRDNPEISISAMNTTGDYVSIIVKDNGCGIPEIQQQNLFKPFYTSKADGTGLGLVITEKLLTMMRGTIEIESTENVGSTVTISILKERRH